MTTRRRKFIVSLLLHAPYLLLLYILQATFFTSLTLFGVKPLILPVAVVGVALFEGPAKGGAFGLFAGMLCDLAFNQPTVQFTLIFTLLGILVGFVCDTVMARGFPSYLAITAVSLVVVSFLQMFGLLFFRDAQFLPLFDTAIRQTLYSLLFAIPLYYCARAISRRTHL